MAMDWDTTDMATHMLMVTTMARGMLMLMPVLMPTMVPMAMVWLDTVDMDMDTMPMDILTLMVMLSTERGQLTLMLIIVLMATTAPMDMGILMPTVLMPTPTVVMAMVFITNLLHIVKN